MEDLMLTAITARSEIAQCQQKLAGALKAGLATRQRLRIGHQGGSFVDTVFHGAGLWYSTYREEEVEIPRYWNGFGTGKSDDTDQIIAVEINMPVEGYEARVSGVFARDDGSGEYLVLHRGRIGGGRKGIGKNAFRNWSRNAWVEVAGPKNARDEAILVARLGSTDTVEQIKAFVSEVAAFKKEASSGQFTRKPSTPNTKKTFNPEFHGKKKGHRSGNIEYESFHGLVVNTLEKVLTAANKDGRRNVFNTSEIDLGIEIGGHLRQLYEVKSSADSHAVYTGTGQLMLHSLLGTDVDKTLVLPKGEISQTLRKRLASLDIGVLEYRIKGAKVTFSG